MLITNEFTIDTYDGRLPLTLLLPPSGMDASTQQSYNVFLNNIITIYGNQNDNGSVPVFFKNAQGIPSSGSTLTQLDSGKEYYFISKNSASFPYAVPAIGGSALGVCKSLEPCCPFISFPSSYVTLSGPPENTYAYITAVASGLTPGKVYNYEYSLVAANWPSKVSPVSGTFIPMTYSDTIENVFSFCPSTGNASGYFDYSVDPEVSRDFVQKNIFSTLEIKLYPLSGSNCPVMSDKITVKCDKCLPHLVYRPTVSINNGPKILVNNNCCSNPVPVSVDINGADPGRNYTFSVTCWPEDVVATPSSGNFSFGDGNGRILTMIDTNSNVTSVIKFNLNDDITGETFVDFASIVCNSSC